MESLGQKLHEARLRLGLALENVSANTRIPLKLLLAVEEDDLSKFSSAFQYKSFVRQFASELKIDIADVASSLEAAASRMPKPLVPGESDYRPPKLPALQAPNVRWIYPIGYLFVMLVACCALYTVWQSSKSHLQTGVTRSSSVHQEIAQPAPQTQAADAPGVTSDQPRSDAPPSVAPATPNSAEPAGAFRIELSAIERTWLSIVADGKHTFSGILETAETKVLEGHNKARIRTGNAGGVNVVFNGRTLGTLGARGQVETVIFTKDGYEILEPPPHIALAFFNPNGG